MPSTPSKPSTVAKKVGQGAQVGRPVVIPYRNLTMQADRSRMEGYRFLWQKIKPQSMERAQELMDTHTKMPAGLMPEALKVVRAREHRRDH